MIKRNLKVYRFEEIDSTNNFAKSIGEKSTDDSLIIANTQTAGRGRIGRSFYSPKGGIYMSILLHPQKELTNVSHITVMASVAVARAIENVLNIKTSIKWVNDIFYEDKKVCGILTEGKYDSHKECFEYAVLGVGINLFKPKNGYPAEIQNIAGFLTESGKENLKQKLIDAFLKIFFEIYGTNENILEEYKARSNVLGKEIEYIKDGQIFRTKAVDISKDLELVVENGEKLNSGEIKILTESLR